MRPDRVRRSLFGQPWGGKSEHRPPVRTADRYWVTPIHREMRGDHRNANVERPRIPLWNTPAARQECNDQILTPVQGRALLRQRVPLELVSNYRPR